MITYTRINKLRNKGRVTMIYPVKIFFIAFSCAAASVSAETLYKSVNDKGEITFSDSPPENAAQVQEIQVQPAPTEQQQRDSMELEKRIDARANELGDANAARAQEREEQEQAAPATTEVVEPVETYNSGYNYNEFNTEAPNRPVQPLPGRPVQLPARPVLRPAR
jgi:hypothetical protein